MAVDEISGEKESNDRRERLRALRAAQELSETPEPKEIPQDLTVERLEKEDSDVEETSVERAAAARSKRLKALRAANELLSTPDESSVRTEESDEQMKLNLKFRNYLPHDEKLQGGKLSPAVLPKFEDPIAAAPPQPEKIEDPFLNIAPKKPNWDLRRDVQKKLEKLEKRTQKAIYQLIQDKERENEALEAANGTSDD